MDDNKTIYFCNKTIDPSTIKSASKWKDLNPDYNIVIYDNTMCEDFLLKEYSELYKNIFLFIKDGPIKADFWRLCVLYKYGGIYSDIDNVPLVPLKEIIEDNIDLVTCSSYWVESGFSFNPNFIVAKKNNPILKKCIYWYVYKYVHKLNYSYWQWSIMCCFTNVLKLQNYNKDDGVYIDIENNLRVQIIKECSGDHHYDAHNIYNNIRVFNNRSLNWDANSHSFIK